MSFANKYDDLIKSFEEKRREMLNFVKNVVPTPMEMHQRIWKIQQINNAIDDLKTTLAAENIQIEKERSILDDLANENERLQAQERKLIEDIKLLEGVSGKQAIIPCNTNSGLMGEISIMAEQFRDNFACFYFRLPNFKQEIHYDNELEKDGHILISCLKDYVSLRFDLRSSEAHYTKIAEEKSSEADKIARELNDNQLRIEREIENQRKTIEDEAGKCKDFLYGQTRDLRVQGRATIGHLKTQKEDLEMKTQHCQSKRERLSNRLTNLVSQKRATKENFRRRMNEIELELEKFESRINFIKASPNVVDCNLINIALILTEKSQKITDAISEMKKEISDLSNWITK